MPGLAPRPSPPGGRRDARGGPAACPRVQARPQQQPSGRRSTRASTTTTSRRPSASCSARTATSPAPRCCAQPPSRWRHSRRRRRRTARKDAAADERDPRRGRLACFAEGTLLQSCARLAQTTCGHHQNQNQNLYCGSYSEV